jgi:AI-2 transport protein TqsA
MKEINEKFMNVCLMILAFVAIVTALIYAKNIFIPFVISIFIYFILSPLFKFFQFKGRLPKSISMIIVILIFLGISFSVVFFTANSIDSFFESTDEYQKKILSFIDWGDALIKNHNIDVGATTIKDYVKQLPFFSMFKKFTGGMFSFIGNSFLIMIFVLFMFWGQKRSSFSSSTLEEIKQKISRYVITKFFLSLLTGTIVTIILLSCNVDLAIMFGILTVLLNFIPNIGSIIATILPLPVVLIQFGFSWPFYIVLILSSVFQFTIGNILEPKIMGGGLDLHPITVLLFLMFWGLIWGIPGMFLAVPITSVIKIVLSKIDATKPVAELLAGRVKAR